MSMYSHRIVPSQFGDLAVIGQGHETAPIARILIPTPQQTVAARLHDWAQTTPGSEPRIEHFCAQLTRYLAGEVIELSIDLLDWSVCTPFQKRVLLAEYAIPRGQVRTYAQVAQLASSPRGARAAGNALAGNPFPIVIPCHRAIRADGSLGGYYGGVDMKRALLEMEGVRFDSRGRVRSGNERSDP